MNASQVETNLNGLRPKLISIPLIKKQFTVPTYKATFRTSARSSTKWEKNFTNHSSHTNAITTYEAYGLTMNKIVVDLQVPLQTLQVASVYVPLSRVKRAEDTVILRPFDMKVLPVRPSLAQDAELKRLDELDKKTKRECTSFIS
ncbi:unnamed protein product [Adineta ricciae]|uniref:Uncharacterized protein n=1 Tax=Adineta ricciae TaxID=249248 RepID=A0A816C2G7_ADIRI|nr:unnamed protein product [Adineta ricciae]CAF1618403.1 unnamed protein product [Adineta ricciae]